MIIVSGLISRILAQPLEGGLGGRADVGLVVVEDGVDLGPGEAGDRLKGCLATVRYRIGCKIGDERGVEGRGLSELAGALWGAGD